jgi:hypothetical protein
VIQRSNVFARVNAATPISIPPTLIRSARTLERVQLVLERNRLARPAALGHILRKLDRDVVELLQHALLVRQRAEGALGADALPFLTLRGCDGRAPEPEVHAQKPAQAKSLVEQCKRRAVRVDVAARLRGAFSSARREGAKQQGRHLDSDGLEQPLVHTPDAGDLSNREVARELNNGVAVEREMELSIRFVLRRVVSATGVRRAGQKYLV